MLDWLKKVTKYKPAPVKVAQFEARLSAPDGTTAVYGDIEFDTYEGGDWKLEIEIEHPKGAPESPFDIRFNGVSVAIIEADKGFDTEKTFSTAYYDLVQHPMIGTKVEVHGPSGLLLTGTFVDDR